MSTKIDWTIVRQLEKDGWVSVRKHNTADLFILNYTQRTQWEKHWTAETLQCRGLIIDSEGNIHARPFRKFFNYEEIQAGDIPLEPFDVYEKLDGSLVISYCIDGKMYCASRGSFDSEQATVATEILHHKYGHIELDPRYTYCWEVIYPENKIVVDYENIRDLFLLAVIHTATGNEVAVTGGFPTPKRYDGIHSLATIRQQFNIPNAEGFVVRFKSGFRLKMKFEEYLRLHRLLTGVSRRNIWEYLKDGKSLEPLLDHVPDEFHDWVKQQEQDLNKAFHDIVNEAHGVFTHLVSLGYNTNRKKFAEAVQLHQHKALLFYMLDGKDYAPYVWKCLYPPDERLFIEKGDSDG